MTADDAKLDTLIAALRDYRQADEDGVMVLVSRQACDEAAAALAAAQSKIAEQAQAFETQGTVFQAAINGALLSLRAAEAERDALREIARAADALRGNGYEPRPTPARVAAYDAARDKLNAVDAASQPRAEDKYTRHD